MHTLFARARTTSTKNLPKTPHTHPTTQDPHTDEFGRVHSRGQGAATFAGAPALSGLPQSPAKGSNARQRTVSSNVNPNGQGAVNFANANGSSVYLNASVRGSYDHQQYLQPGAAGGFVEDGFLPTSIGQVEVGQMQYGYLSFESHVVLAVEDVTRLVEVVSEELGNRGECSIISLPFPPFSRLLCSVGLVLGDSPSFLLFLLGSLSSLNEPTFRFPLIPLPPKFSSIQSNPPSYHEALP